MADKLQTSIGGTTTVPANGTVEFSHQFDKTRTVNLFEASKITNAAGRTDVTVKVIFVSEADGNVFSIQTDPNDGADDVDPENVVPFGSPVRIPSLIQVADNDTVKVTFSNSGASAESVEFDISTAATTTIQLGTL